MLETDLSAGGVPVAGQRREHLSSAPLVFHVHLAACLADRLLGSNPWIHPTFRSDLEATR